jgi:hypothetical protein
MFKTKSETKTETKMIELSISETKAVVGGLKYTVPVLPAPILPPPATT